MGDQQPPNDPAGTTPAASKSSAMPTVVIETPPSEPNQNTVKEAHENVDVSRVVRPESEALLNGNTESTTANGDEIRIVPGDGEPGMARVQLRVYPQRWLVLAVVALLNNINCIAWIAYAPVANYVDSYYHWPDATNWFSMMYMVVTVPVGFVAMWAGRYFGLRTAILIAAAANAIGVAIRLASSFLPHNVMFPVGVTGQAIAAIAYPFIMFLPTKVAGSWFGSDQRGLATTIGVMANPLGVLISNIIAPQLVKAPQHVLHLNIIVAVVSIVIAIMAFLGVRSSEPKTPPTLSAATEQMKFIDGMKACFTNKQYMILLVVMGAGIGMFNCLYTIMQQLLCPYHYENWFSGLCAAMMITGGVIGATISGIFVDRTHRYTETMKVSMTSAVIFGLTFLQLSMVREISWAILIVCFLFGVMGLAMYPVGLEMSAECTFPVTETTSTGLVVLCGQVQSVIFTAIMMNFHKKLPEDKLVYQVCDAANPSKAHDWSTSIIIISAIAVTMALILVIFFKPVYKRMNAEKGDVIVREEGTKVMLELENVDPTAPYATTVQPASANVHA